MYSLTFPIPNLAIATFGSDHLDVFVELEEADLFIMFDIREILEKSCESKIDVFHLRDNLRDLLLKRIEQNGIYA